MARRTSPTPEPVAPVAAPLFDDAPARQSSLVAVLPLSCIREAIGHNPRTDYGEESGELAALAESIRTDGLLSNIVVRRDPDRPAQYLIVAGHRRFEAARIAGMEYIPVSIRPVGDDADPVALALAENLQRKGLNPLEEALGFQRLESMGWSQERIAQAVGRSQSHVSRAISLLSLPEGTRTMLREGLLSASHGAELVPLWRVWGAEQIDATAGQAVADDWSVARLRDHVAQAIAHEERRVQRAQTTLPVDDTAAPDYAASHNGAGSPPAAGDALTRPAAAPEVRPGYTQADAKAEYEASQRPDPDETTPVKDALARLERLTPGADTEEAGGWESTGSMTAAERAAWLEESGLTIAEAIDNLRASEEDGDDLRVTLDDESRDMLQILAQDYSASSGRLLREDSWIDQLIQDAARGVLDELLAAGVLVIGLTPEDAGRLRLIAEDMGEEPQEMLTAMLTVWAQVIRDRRTADDDEDQEGEAASSAPARPTGFPPLPKGSDRWVLWHWKRGEGEEAYRHNGPVIVGGAALWENCLADAEAEARMYSLDDWTDEEADTVIGIGHQLYHGEQFGERAATYWHRGECVEVRQGNGELRIVGGEA